MRTAVVIAWRDGETELQATIDSVSESIGKAQVCAVEDKTGAGPARTRHRGIEAAKGCDVVIIVDAHMRFHGSVLSDMAREVRRNGGLYCAKCHHNEECTFDAKHPSGKTWYAGADIHYKGHDQNGRQALVWKWSDNPEAGPRACVGGACYAFSRSWYYEVGQPLAALPAWGCDEEALSISAWYSGYEPTVFDGHVAHRWRPSPPWKSASNALVESRAALISAVVHDYQDLSELLKYQGVEFNHDPSVEIWRSRLVDQPRTWNDWKAAVPIMPQEAASSIEPAIPQNHGCAHQFAPTGYVYPNGRQLMRCTSCGQTRLGAREAVQK